MKSDEHNIDETVGTRSQVSNTTIFLKYKEKILFIGIALICLLIALGGLLPKSKTNQVTDEDNKENISQQLNQNLALIASLKEKSKTIQSDDQNNELFRLSEHETVTKETLARMNAPSTFFSISPREVVGNNSSSQQRNSVVGYDVNNQFLNQQNDITSLSAKKLPHATMTVLAGEIIPATLEIAINSELAGMVRAITSRDIYAFSGDRLLIPKGSTLIGQFNTAITQGQSRVFIVWNRLQLTDGIIVTLNSPSADSIGRSGQAADYIDRHFFERFSGGALLSVLGAYTAAGGVHSQDEYNSLSQYRMNVAGSFQQTANQTFQQDMQIRPTLQVNQGTSINVFVAHDLDFYRISGKY